MTSVRTTPGRRRAGPLVALLLAAPALLAACGGGGSHAAASASPSGSSAQSSARQNGVLFDSCIETHGFPDFPDSAVSVNGDQLEIHIPGNLKREPQFQSVLQLCQRDLPGGGPQAKHVNIAEEINFARCMRSHGITDFPDPLPGGGWDVPGDTNTPQFEAAAHACQVTGIHWNGS
jgi:hypothetical protein